MQRHNTVYLFEVDKTTPPTAQEVVRFAVYDFIFQPLYMLHLYVRFFSEEPHAGVV